MKDPVAASANPTDLFLGHVKQAVKKLIPPANDSNERWTPPSRDGNDPLHQAVTAFAKTAVRSEAGLNRISSLLNWIATTFEVAKDRRINNTKAKTEIIGFLNDCQVEPAISRDLSHTFEQNEVPLNLSLKAKSNTDQQSKSFTISVATSGEAMNLCKLSKADLEKSELEFVMSINHDSRFINPKFSSQDSKLNAATRNVIATIVKAQLEQFIEARDVEVGRLATLMSSITSGSTPETITKVTFQPAFIRGGEKEGDAIYAMGANTFEIEFKQAQPIQLIDSFDSQSPFGGDKVDRVSYNGASLHPQATIMNLVDPNIKATFDERIGTLLKKARELNP